MEGKTKFDAYQMATDRITALLEKGIKPWAQPWTSAKACAWSGNDGRVYSFVNQMLLADPDKEYKTLGEVFQDVRGEWLTFKQAQDRGGHVKKGAKGRKVVFYKLLDKPTGKQDENGEEEVDHIPMLKCYTVFHIRDCEGIEQKYHLNGDKLFDFTADTTAEEIAADYIKREGINYSKVQGDKAYYSPSIDTVVTPLPEQFKDSTEYYSTLFHELTHSTGHKNRLDRLDKCAAFGSETYSTEELVAEIGSASILATLGIETPGTLNNSAAYCKNWLKALKNDKKMIVVASARAEKAIRMILNVA